MRILSLLLTALLVCTTCTACASKEETIDAASTVIIENEADTIVETEPEGEASGEQIQTTADQDQANTNQAQTLNAGDETHPWDIFTEESLILQPDGTYQADEALVEFILENYGMGIAFDANEEEVQWWINYKYFDKNTYSLVEELTGQVEADRWVYSENPSEEVHRTMVEKGRYGLTESIHTLYQEAHKGSNSSGSSSKPVQQQEAVVPEKETGLKEKEKEGLKQEQKQQVQVVQSPQTRWDGTPCSEFDPATCLSDYEGADTDGSIDASKHHYAGVNPEDLRHGNYR